MYSYLTIMSYQFLLMLILKVYIEQKQSIQSMLIYVRNYLAVQTRGKLDGNLKGGWNELAFR